VAPIGVRLKKRGRNRGGPAGGDGLRTRPRCGGLYQKQ
jgi:hypothetical protein